LQVLYGYGDPDGMANAFERPAIWRLGVLAAPLSSTPLRYR
jgi:hypothetical protein